MERDNKILISAILIVGIAIFASSLNIGISGKAVSKCVPPSATISPNSGPAGTTFTFNIGGYIYMPVDVIRASGGAIVESTRNWCGSNVCPGGGTYKLKTLGDGSWVDGDYYLKARTCEKVGGLRDRVKIPGSDFTIKDRIATYSWGSRVESNP